MPRATTVLIALLSYLIPAGPAGASHPTTAAAIEHVLVGGYAIHDNVRIGPFTRLVCSPTATDLSKPEHHFTCVVRANNAARLFVLRISARDGKLTSVNS